MSYEVTREGFVAVYQHRKYVIPTYSKDVAISITEMLHQAINDLATKYAVFIRLSPEYRMETDFGSLEPRYTVVCRYSFTEPTEIKPAGKYSVKTYDNDSVSGFGLG